jgi:tetratricopeptide (TPR) repeat protein
MTEEPAARALGQAEMLLAIGRYEQALSKTAEALAAQPNNPAAFAVRARAMSGLGRLSDARIAADRAVALSPGSAGNRRLLASLLTGMARKTKADHYADDAVPVALKAVSLAPSEPAGYAVLAEAYALVGRFGEADNAIRQAIGLGPRRAATWVAASLVAMAAHNWQAAETAARAALAIEPQNQAAINNLGVVMERRGKWKASVIAFHDAARIDPRWGTARENAEAVGFQYLGRVLFICLLPLLLVCPLFFLATRLVAGQRERLKPLARRLGLRVANSRRYRRRYAEEAAQSQRAVEAALGPVGWTALGGSRHLERAEVVGVVVALLFFGLLMGWAVLMGLLVRHVSPPVPTYHDLRVVCDRLPKELVAQCREELLGGR